ncbi:hypothetical protein Tco_0324522 [Tanacetum coccineum]
MEQISRIQEQTILRARDDPGRRPGKEPMLPEKERDENNIGEKVTICAKRSDQSVMIESTLLLDCNQWLINILRKNMDVLAWPDSGGIAVPRFVMEHQLKAYLLAEPIVHKRRPLTPDRRQALREKVSNWLKEGTIKKVQYPEWITNVVLIKMARGTWQVQVDYSSLNRVCAKDMYPFLDVEEELASLMGYPYKCFLQLPKKNSQIRMVEDDEEKTGFHTKEGALADQKGRNVEVYLEDIVVKSKDEQILMEDMEDTLNKLKWVNMKINPNESTYGIKEGRCLGYTITEDGIRPDPAKIQAVIKSHTLRGLDQIRHLSLQLASIDRREKCRYSAYTKRVRQSALCYLWKEKEFKYPSLMTDGEQIPQAEGTTATHVKRTRGADTQTKQQTLSRTNPNAKGMEVEGSRTPLTEEARKYMKEIIDAVVPFHRFRITNLPKKLNFKAEVLTGLATIKLEVLNQEVLLGIKIKPSVEVRNDGKDGKATRKVPTRKPSYNWETSGSNLMNL